MLLLLMHAGVVDAEAQQEHAGEEVEEEDGAAAAAIRALRTHTDVDVSAGVPSREGLMGPSGSPLGGDPESEAAFRRWLIKEEMQPCWPFILATDVGVMLGKARDVAMVGFVAITLLIWAAVYL